LEAASEEEMTRVALQSAEELQAALAALPEHLRGPVARQCIGLRGLLDGKEAQAPPPPSDEAQAATSSEAMLL